MKGPTGKNILHTVYLGSAIRKLVIPLDTIKFQSMSFKYEKKGEC